MGSGFVVVRKSATSGATALVTDLSQCAGGFRNHVCFFVGKPRDEMIDRAGVANPPQSFARKTTHPPQLVIKVSNQRFQGTWVARPR